jgi:hypothetical protein
MHWKIFLFEIKFKHEKKISILIIDFRVEYFTPSDLIVFYHNIETPELMKMKF